MTVLKTLRVAALGVCVLAFALSAHAEDMQTVSVLARDKHLQPERITVPAGKRFKIVIRNEGPGPVEVENLDLHVEKVLAPGATSFIIVPSLKPGRYVLVDEFHPTTGHIEILVQ